MADQEDVAGMDSDLWEFAAVSVAEPVVLLQSKYFHPILRPMAEVRVARHRCFGRGAPTFASLEHPGQWQLVLVGFAPGSNRKSEQNQIQAPGLH